MEQNVIVQPAVTPAPATPHPNRDYAFVESSPLKRLATYGIIWVFALLSIVFLWTTVITDAIDLIRYRNNEIVQQAKTTQILQDIPFYANGKRALFVVIPATLLLLSVMYVRAETRRKAIYTCKIGQSEIPVREKDLSLAAPIGLGLVTAEQMRQTNGGAEKAIELYSQLADIQAKQVQTLTRSARVHLPADAMPQTAELSQSRETIPTFQELYARGDLAPGRPMILGFESGQPRRGSFLDIYSAAVAGESGSGKTATMLFLIGSALLSMPIRFCGIDPHYPHPKSLGSKTKPLWEAGLMRIATYKDDILALLKEIEQIIDRRLRQIDTDDTPVVLVIDELAFLSKTSIGNAVAHTMERISTEGRKCAVYLLASSQTWLASHTGGSSVVRDTLTSAFVHRIKPKQANLLLQDKDAVEKVKRFVKQAGEALLVPVGNEPIVISIPYTTERDMQQVAECLGRRQAFFQPTPAAPTLTERPQSMPQVSLRDIPTRPRTVPIMPTELDAEFDRLLADDALYQAQIADDTQRLRDNATELLTTKRISYDDIFNETGISKSTMFNFVNGSGNLKPEKMQALRAYLNDQEHLDRHFQFQEAAAKCGRMSN